jgi:ATP-dependent Clp protease ATP-binding subunit ClpC
MLGLLRRLLIWLRPSRPMRYRCASHALQALAKDRFTDRALAVIEQAYQAARCLKHDYIGTEHVLLAIIKEGSGVAALVLRELTGDNDRIRSELERVIVCGPTLLMISNRPWTPRLREAVEHAKAEARNLKHNFVGTEHLLLGLLHDREGVAACVLLAIGIGPEEVREIVKAVLGSEFNKIDDEPDFA